MPKKVALLIGVSEYGEGIPSLSAPVNDVAAVKRVLEDPNMGEFDEIETRINPDPTAMRLAVQQIFANCHKDDLVLLFFSGHGITDDNNRLYLATKGTSKDFYKATSVPASFIQDVSLESYAKRQAIVLDCCYSGAFAEGWQAKSVGLDLEKELGAEGRVVLTSSTATQTSFQQEGEELSLYTQYLVEGIETGAADKDEDGKIYAHELHDYAKAKVQEVKPKQKPDIISDKEGFNIILSQAPVDDPELDFRKLVEKYATEGKITVAGNHILRIKRQQLGITEEKSDEIVNEVLAPYRKRLENRELYKEAFREAIEHTYPLTERLLNELQDLQDVLGLEDRDIAKDKQQILAEKEAEHQHQQDTQRKEQEEYNKKLQQYEQEFSKAVEREYPLSKHVREQINSWQKSLGLRAEDIKRIEQPILAAQYQEKEKEKDRQGQNRKVSTSPPCGNFVDTQNTNKTSSSSSSQDRFSTPQLKSPPDFHFSFPFRFSWRVGLGLAAAIALPFMVYYVSTNQSEPITSTNGFTVPQLPPSPLISNKTGVDYTPLRDLLEAGKWKEADGETKRAMIQAAGKNREWLSAEDMDNFPCEDLRIIDQLWLKSSQGKFGFSVQKEIYQSLGGTRDSYDEVFPKFSDRVGWNNDFQRSRGENFTFNMNTRRGQLPYKAQVDDLAGPGTLIFSSNNCL